MPHFLGRWLGVTGLSILCSVVAAVGVGFLAYDGTSDASLYLDGAAVLFFAAFSAIGQGWVIRHLLKRPVLWGALTGGGIVLAAVAIEAGVRVSDQLWWPIWRLAFWIRDLFDLSVTPWVFTAYLVSGLTCGLILGSTQAAVLGLGWRVSLRWVAISAGAGVLAAICDYVFSEVDAVVNALWWMAALIPMQRDWRPAFLAMGELLVLGFCYALPTGILMQKLLRGYQGADAEALVQRFE